LWILTADHDDIGPATSFDVIAEVVLRRQSRSRPEKTIQTRRDLLNKYILPFFQCYAISAITASDAEEWLATLKATPSPANHAASLLYGIMRQSEAMGIRAEGNNPMKGLKLFSAPKRQRVLTPDEIRRLDAALEIRKQKYPKEYAFVMLLLTSGAKVGELHRLRWSDYDGCNLNPSDKPIGPQGDYQQCA
jgi:integrase